MPNAVAQGKILVRVAHLETGRELGALQSAACSILAGVPDAFLCSSGGFSWAEAQPECGRSAPNTSRIRLVAGFEICCPVTLAHKVYKAGRVVAE